MIFPRFLDCAYALLVEHYRGLGQDLLSALDKLHEWGVASTPDRNAEPIASVSSESEIALRNDASLLELKKMMGGIA
jgi:hypothetical protein